jgi:hypothetical protein
MKDRRDAMKDCETTPLFWDCECEKDYIHTQSEPTCERCGSKKEEQPDSRINEVLLAYSALVGQVVSERQRLLDQSTSKIFNWKKENGYETRPGNMSNDIEDNMRSAV